MPRHPGASPVRSTFPLMTLSRMDTVATDTWIRYTSLPEEPDGVVIDWTAALAEFTK